MLVSTEVLSLNRYGDNRQIIKLIKDSRFDAYDFTMYVPTVMDAFSDKDEYIERSRAQRKFA
ncbi:MAG: hypothetical protein MJ193_05070, partial [Clostridia bacterium]|nr:hypothetical protein [Clostridia bacterium]